MRKLGLAAGPDTARHRCPSYVTVPNGPLPRPRAGDDLSHRRHRTRHPGTVADPFRDVRRRRPSKVAVEHAGRRSLGRARLQGRLHREGAAHERRERPRARASRDAYVGPGDDVADPRREDHLRQDAPLLPARDGEQEDRAHRDFRPSAHRNRPTRSRRRRRTRKGAHGSSRERFARAPQSRSSRSTSSR